MHFLGMPATSASRLRVSDVTDRLDYNDSLSRKSQSRNNFPLGEYGIRRILFHFLLASRKPSSQSTHIRSPDKTQRIRSVAVRSFHLGFLPPHPGIFCDTALDHLITDYAACRVLQQERFWTSSGKAGGRWKILFKSFENYSLYSIWWTLYSEKS